MMIEKNQAILITALLFTSSHQAYRNKSISKNRPSKLQIHLEENLHLHSVDCPINNLINYHTLDITIGFL